MSQEIKITGSLRTGDLKITAPWGHHDCSTYLAFFRQTRAQLQHYLDTRATPNPAFTRAEIAGYDELLATGSETFAAAFAARKSLYRDRGERPPPNLEVVQTLKAEGVT